MRSQQSGFTLVEIAIVLVIIGLLLGGILKGQELINSAKVKNLANDFRVIPTYIYAFQDKFKALPGDDEHLAGAGDAGRTERGPVERAEDAVLTDGAHHVGELCLPDCALEADAVECHQVLPISRSRRRRRSRTTR